MDLKKLVLKELSQTNMGTLGSVIVRNALLYPESDAFIYKDTVVTFSEHNKRVNSLIYALQGMGVRKQGVIGVLSWNCLEYQDVYGAAEKGGFIIAPYNPRLSPDELDYLINYSEAKAVFVGPEFVGTVNALKKRIPNVKNFISFESPTAGMEFHAELIKNCPNDEPEVVVEEDDLVYMFFTSGTTGVPKGAVYDHRRRFEELLISFSEFVILPGDRRLAITPMFHIGGGYTTRLYFARGCLNVILKQFEARQALNAIHDYHLTDVDIVPTHLALMMDLPDFEKYDVTSLKRILYVGSPMPEELLRKGLKIWGAIFIQSFGQTESGPQITWMHRHDHDILNGQPEVQARLSSCGQPTFGCHVRIVDEKGEDVLPGEVGEIISKSRHTMIEYWRQPEENAKALADGWLHTGDMGRYDEQGYVYLVDRKDDKIISGGENIFPREVEEVLYRHPAVLECSVIGIPHPKWVESVHAVVSFKRGMSATPEELIEFCRQRIARYKAPKSVEILDELPKSSANKILKRVLREKYWLK